MANADTFDQSCPLRGAVICCTSIPAEKRVNISLNLPQEALTDLVLD